jgi:hypothetical protein
MRTRSLVAAAAIAPLLLGAGAAHAAKPKPKPKPVCNLIADAKGDATGTGFGNNGPNDPALDIVSADLATDATRLTAVIRVAALAGSTDTAPTGRGYDVTFSVKGTTFAVRGVLSPAGDRWYDGNGTGVVDKAKNEIRITVPLAKFSVAIKPNDVLTGLKANTWRYVGGTANVPMGRVDDAATGATYKVGSPSCVKVGT